MLTKNQHSLKAARVVGTVCGLRLVILGLALTTMQPGYAQSGVQRLFTTANLRAELDRRRIRSLQPQPAAEEVVAPVVAVPEQFDETQPVADVIYEIGGSMRRNDGSYTIWVNSKAVGQEELPPNIELLSPYSKGYVRIRDPESGTSYTVKPGQVLNLTSGQLMESYQYRALSAASRVPPAVIQTPVDGVIANDTAPETSPQDASDMAAASSNNQQ